MKETKIISDIALAAQDILLGNVVAIPTETVYGLAASIFNESALNDIFKIKGRPQTSPLIVHIGHKDQVQDLCTNVPDVAYELMDAFWPGPLTLLLPKRDVVSHTITSGLNRVGVRMPAHPVALELLQKCRVPLAAPSANPFCSISPTASAHVFNYFNGKLGYILEGGACSVGLESTIIGFEEGKCVVYRQGCARLSGIEKITGPATLYSESTSTSSAPGMLKRHYAPRIPLVFCPINLADCVEKHQGKKVGVLSFSGADDIKSTNVVISLALSSAANEDEAAKNLYASLHYLDSLGLDVIITTSMPHTAIGNAINDRLKRASTL